MYLLIKWGIYNMSYPKSLTVSDSPHTLTSRDYFVLCDCSGGDITLNLPVASDYRPYLVVKTDATSSTVTVEGNGSETVSGSLNHVISRQWESVGYVSDGTGYYITQEASVSPPTDATYIVQTSDATLSNEQALDLLVNGILKHTSGVISAIPPQASLTPALNGLTHTEPGTPDYAIAALTTVSPFGFVSQDEGHTVLKVIASLQTRVSEIEDRLTTASIIGVDTAHGPTYPLVLFFQLE